MPEKRYVQSSNTVIQSKFGNHWTNGFEIHFWKLQVCDIMFFSNGLKQTHVPQYGWVTEVEDVTNHQIHEVLANRSSNRSQMFTVTMLPIYVHLNKIWLGRPPGLQVTPQVANFLSIVNEINYYYY